MKKKILLGILIPYALIIILHLGLLYVVFSYFKDLPILLLIFGLIFVSFLLFTVKIVKQYLASMEYLDTAENLNIELSWSPIAVASSSINLNKFDFKDIFVGGICGEGLLQKEGKSVKIVHQYRSKLFFPTYSSEKLVTALETTYSDDKIAFILRKKHTGIGSKYCVTSSANSGWEYFFFEALRNEDKPIATNIEELLPQGFFKELENLPGENAVMLLNGKITLIHVGFLKAEQEIKQFVYSLSNMAQGN